MTTSERDRLDHNAYRKKHFAIIVEDLSDTSWGSDIRLGVTLNGRQYECLGLSFEEARKVVEALQNRLAKEKP